MQICEWSESNFWKHFKGDIKFPFQCLNQVDSEEHIFFCKGLVSQLKRNQKTLLESVRYTDIYGAIEEQFWVTSIFLVLMRIRTRLLHKDQQPAWAKILDHMGKMYFLCAFLVGNKYILWDKRCTLLLLKNLLTESAWGTIQWKGLHFNDWNIFIQANHISPQ